MITTHVRTLMDDRANDPDNPLPATITVKVAVGGLIHECVKLIPAKETNTAEVLSELSDAYGQILARVRESDPGSAHLEQTQQNLETPTGNQIQVLWTRHGHWVPRDREPTDIDMTHRPKLVARCGGPGLCPECALDAGTR